MIRPSSSRRVVPTPAPIRIPAGPTVGTTALATMYSSASMVCGNEADSAASRNRFRLIASSTIP